MYAFIKGKVAQLSEDSVAIDASGVGYEVYTTNGALSRMREGQEVTLYTHLNVKEDELSLFGFLSREEKDLFRRLISVSGVGPKMGLAVLSILTPSEAALAIATGDHDAFARVSGIGKKTAQRIILELRGKVDPASLGAQVPAGAAAVDGGVISEAVAVLMAMGFNAADASAAVALVRAEGGSSEQMAMRALRALDRK